MCDTVYEYLLALDHGLYFRLLRRGAMSSYTLEGLGGFLTSKQQQEGRFFPPPSPPE